MGNKEIEMDVLEIRRTYSANRSKVFKALTDAKLLSKWMNAAPDGYSKVESDCRVGGVYKIVMYSESGEIRSEVGGEYLEIAPERKVVCTWIAKGFVDYSVLSFELQDVDGGTELLLSHKLPKPAIEPHSMGWPNCLDRLGNVSKAEVQ